MEQVPPPTVQPDGNSKWPAFPMMFLGTFGSRSPEGRKRVERWLGLDAPPVYEAPPVAPDASDFEFELTRATIAGGDAERVLGFVPVSREQGLSDTLDWLRYARIVPAR